MRSTAHSRERSRIGGERGTARIETVGP
jgi:hypothetical protein